MDSLLISKQDAAAALGVCLKTIDNMIAGKQLVARRISVDTTVRKITNYE